MGSKCAKLTFVRMREMPESSPPQKEQTVSGKEGEEKEGESEMLTCHLENEVRVVSGKRRLVVRLFIL